MILTFQDQLNIVKEVSGLSDDLNVTKFKRDINTGGARFMAALNRDFNREARSTDIKNNQADYQFPVDLRLVGDVVVNIGAVGGAGGWRPPLTMIANETEWNYMNTMNQTGLPTHFFVKGNNQISLYPIPSYDQTAGLTIAFVPEMLHMTAMDFTTAQVTTTNNSTLVTHSASGFTQNMVGYWFETADDSDENSYQIASFVDSSHINLANVFQGIGETVNFRIGPVMNMPHPYLEAPADYALYRHFTRRGNPKANGFLQSYDQMLTEAKDQYGQMSESQVVNAEFEDRRTFNSFRGDSPFSIIG